MTDEETIKAVTAKLMGEFYVGQRVRLRKPRAAPRWLDFRGEGVIHEKVGVDIATMFRVTWDVEGAKDYVYLPRDIEPV